MEPQQLIRNLTLCVRDAVIPHLGEWRARRVTGVAASGDATFRIDEIAEAAVADFLDSQNVNVAYYTEDRGLIFLHPDKKPEAILVIDPIDGTRAAVAGFESCVVSAAWADYRPNPTFQDVRYGGVAEIKGDLLFTAERGKGFQVERISDGTAVPAQRSEVTDIERMAWTCGVVAAPAQPLFRVLGDLVNRTTVRGGFFILNSSAFELTRLVNGQLAALVDVRTRLLRDYQSYRTAFLTEGGGKLISLYAYDIAGGALIAQEAGCRITDGWGNDLSTMKLLETSEAHLSSIIAAANDELHQKLLEAVNEGFKNL